MSTKRPNKIPTPNTPDFINRAPEVSESPEPKPKPKRLSLDLSDELEEALREARHNTRKTYRALVLEAVELHPDIAAALAKVRESAEENK